LSELIKRQLVNISYIKEGCSNSFLTVLGCDK